MLLSVNWNEIFIPSKSLTEIILRGSLTYLALFVLIRFVLKRESGAIGTADLLMVVLIADAAQNAMANDYHSVTEGVILVATIIFWNIAIDWLGYHFPALRRIIQPQPLLLVKDGRMYKRNMRKELITKEELLGELREQGVEDLDEVKEARIEEDGHISVIKRNAQGRES
ncbi:MAG: DUF421 domain-containing protein [Pyrinomonadaceae bacterium]